MKIALIGYGKMGRSIETVTQERGHEIVGRFSSSHPVTAEELHSADVAIEFSRPELAVDHINTCFDANCPVIVGTTGWMDHFDAVRNRCDAEGHALLYASNFSLGVNILFKLNEMLAEMMAPHSDYKPSIEEIHHTEKLDSPSGTGITLAEGILANQSRRTGWVNQATDSADQLEIISKREPKVPGTHIVSYRSDIDDLELTHIAKNRKGFALGSVMAAEWLVGKKGIFTMQDVLNIRS